MEKVKPKLICEPGSSRTKQSFRDQVNINKILAKHKRTGMLTHVNKKAPFYGDVTEISDYQESLIKIKKAEDLFNNMSADIRERFKNDPNEMITFLENEENIPEAIELGMVLKKPTENDSNETPTATEPTPTTTK